MIEIRLIGSSAAPERDLYVGRVVRVDEWPAKLALLREPFVAFTALDARRLTNAQLGEFASKLLIQGCVYACAWGPDSGRVETAFDLAAVEANLAGQPFVADVVMTTSHEDESLDDALWFSVFTAFPPDVDARSVLAVSEETWASEIELRLADCERWSADVLRADEDADA
jgi:hypothetical protein